LDSPTAEIHEQFTAEDIEYLKQFPDVVIIAHPNAVRVVVKCDFSGNTKDGRLRQNLAPADCC
jgi:quinolinate synthase